MRIIFLDIDGVLNNRKSIMTQAEKKTLWLMDPECVERLNTIIDRTNAKIVISSSWRHGRTTQEIEDVLADHSFRHRGAVVGATPKYLTDAWVIKKATNGVGLKMSLHIYRAWEILEWLTHNTVESFVVLDDDHIWFSYDRQRKPKPLREMMRRFVHTETELGLTDEHVSMAVKHLMLPLPRRMS